MQKPLTLGALALVAVVALTGFRGGCGRPDHRDPAQVAAFATARLDDALDDVDATPDQRARIQAIKDRVLARAQALRAGREDARQALLAEWSAASVDRAKVHALVDARAAELQALAHEVADAAIEAHGVLTPEQRAKLARKAERLHGLR